MKINSRQGFTLIELLVVIAIIGILSGLIIVGMSSSTASARIAKAQVFNSTLRDSLMGMIEGDWSLDASANDTWNNVAGTFTGAPTLVSSGCPSSAGCYSFSGTGQYATTPNTGSRYTVFTNPMTVMVWAKGASQVSRAIFANWDTNVTYKQAWNISTVANGTSLRVRLADTTTQTNLKDYYTAINVMDNTWHLLGFDWGGGGTLTLYVDGNEIVNGSVTKTTDLAVASIAATAASSVSIACDMVNNVASNLFTGSIDSARLFNAAIPTSQIKEEYFAGLGNLLAIGEITKSEYDTRIDASSMASR